jgi:hypothetical protein
MSGPRTNFALSTTRAIAASISGSIRLLSFPLHRRAASKLRLARR